MHFPLALKQVGHAWQDEKASVFDRLYMSASLTLFFCVSCNTSTFRWFPAFRTIKWNLEASLIAFPFIKTDEFLIVNVTIALESPVVTQPFSKSLDLSRYLSFLTVSVLYVTSFLYNGSSFKIMNWIEWLYEIL